MQKYCNIVKNKLHSLVRSMEKNVSYFVVDPKRDFVRKSELSFSKTMKFILGMGSQTLGKELMEFYDFNPKIVSVSAIVQRRSKILPAAFQYLFHEFNNEFSQTNFFHGYRLYAVDGSDIHIPTIPDNKETFYRANDDSKGYNLMHLNALYDLNDCNTNYNEHSFIYHQVSNSAIFQEVIHKKILLKICFSCPYHIGTIKCVKSPCAFVNKKTTTSCFINSIRNCS